MRMDSSISFVIFPHYSQCPCFALLPHHEHHYFPLRAIFMPLVGDAILWVSVLIATQLSATTECITIYLKILLLSLNIPSSWVFGTHYDTFYTIIGCFNSFGFLGFYTRTQNRVYRCDMKVEVKLSKKTEKIIRQWGNMRKGGAGGYRDEHDQHTKYICMSTLKWIDLNENKK